MSDESGPLSAGSQTEPSPNAHRSTAAGTAADEITLNTIRQWAERTMVATTEAQRGTSSGGFRQAAFDVLAILEKHGAPPGEPVNYRSVFGR